MLNLRSFGHETRGVLIGFVSESRFLDDVEGAALVNGHEPAVVKKKKFQTDGLAGERIQLSCRCLSEMNDSDRQSRVTMSGIPDQSCAKAS